MSRGKVLVAKPGMDAHWRGVAVVLRVLRDAGFEVVYIGHASPAEIAVAALQEDVDVVGLSTLSGNHLTETRALLAELERVGILDQLAVVLGGSVPPADASVLRGEGVDAVLAGGASPKAIVAAVEGAVRRTRDRSQGEPAPIGGTR